MIAALMDTLPTRPQRYATDTRDRQVLSEET